MDEQQNDMQAFEAAFGGNEVSTENLTREQVQEKLRDIARGFRIVSVEYNCGVPDCPTHKGTVEEFLEHVTMTVLLLSLQLGSNAELDPEVTAFAGAAQAQASSDSGSGPLASYFGL